MKRVLIIITTQFVPFGGLTTVMMNYYRAMDLTGLQIDFASTNIPPESLINEISIRGSKYYNLGRRKNVFRYMHNLRKIIKENGYNVVHVNGNSASMAIDLIPAFFGHVSCRIAHVHSSGSDYPAVNAILLPIFKRLYTVSIAASQDAGTWLFKEKFLVLNDAIDVEKYLFSEDIRALKRKQIGLDQKFVLGTVGKLTENKNHRFLIDIFCNINRLMSNCVLVLAGDGPLKAELEAKCTDMGLTNVIFLGMRNDVSELLQSFDYFIFPSKLEGFGMALLEAQASGLKCLASNSIPEAVNVSGVVKTLDLNDGYQKWADYIIKTMKYDRKSYSENACRKIREKGFDIREVGAALSEIYNSGIEES